MSEIAQHIKLIDYFTRYDWGPYHYPGPFFRIKKDNWNKDYLPWQEASRIVETLLQYCEIIVVKQTRWKENISFFRMIGEVL